MTKSAALLFPTNQANQRAALTPLTPCSPHLSSPQDYHVAVAEYNEGKNNDAGASSSNAGSKRKAPAASSDAEEEPKRKKNKKKKDKKKKKNKRKDK